MIKKLYKDSYRINEWGPFGNVKTYLLVGKEKAVLIDSGYGRKDLSEKVSRITDKPVMLVLTHGHIDHVGGSFRFSDVYLNKEDREIFKHHTDSAFRNRNFKATPHQYPNPHDIGPGAIDLGGRMIDVIKTPGHTKGSISIIDKHGKTAFIGDFINPWDTWLGLEESTNVKEYLDSLKYFRKIRDENGIEKIYSGHNLLPMSPSIVDDYIVLCEKIIRKEFKNPKYTDRGICKGYVSKYKKAKLIYKEEID